jgi:hypothetical protein
MRVEIDIPDFVSPARVIHILAGMEPVGKIDPHTYKVYVKVSRCSRCGQCCQKVDCPFLIQRPGAPFECGLNLERPYICCVSEPRDIETCTVQYREL